jgi:adenylyltransferase/sulfurtransferase
MAKMNHETSIKEEAAGGSETTAQLDTIKITDPAKDRYHTFGFISWWKQEIVRQAKVMVVGAGALGNEVLKNLALMGIGHIFIIDFDTIEDSNLSRSVLFRTADNGCRKAEVAAKAILELNPDVKVQWFHGDIRHQVGLGLYRRMDAVMGCLDNREARLAINQACWHLGKPWVDGAIQELLGIARVFWPNRGACYECTLTDEDYQIISARESCQYLAHQNIIEGKVPTTPTISSIIASIQTQETLKILHDMEVQTGQAFVFNGLNNDVFTMDYAEKEECQSHWLYDEITELKEVSAQHTTLAELLTIAREFLGEAVALQIPRFVTATVCTRCDITTELMRPAHNLTFADAHCPECGELMDIRSQERVKGGESFLKLTLNQVGIPPLDIVPAVTPDWQYRFFELTRDADSFLAI